MAFVQGTTSFYILRFLLGVAEAGFFPGIILYLSYWFPAARRAQVTAIFMAAAPLSTALGSPVSAALLEMHGFLGYAGWQWMFVLEALPALVLGVVVLFFLTDRPAKAKWLTDQERAWLENAMQDEERARAAKQSHSSAWRGLADIRVWRWRWSISVPQPGCIRLASGPRKSFAVSVLPRWRLVS